jgi:murein L,D-transpeptidase YafK
LLMSAWLPIFVPAVSAGSVPAALIALPENENAILVEKQTQKFYIYTNEPPFDGIKKVFETACSTGEVFGPKHKSGDKKTPEGIYFLIDEYEERYLTPIYGKRAFPIDYPNFVDTRLGKNGSAIWIHGTDKALKSMDTNGCIAVENDDVAMLSDYITLHATPLVIVEKIQYMTPQEQQRKKELVQSFVDNWVQAHITGSYHHYLSFYSPGYLPDISWWESWVKLRKTADDPAENIHIQISDMGIYQHQDMVVAVMDFRLVLKEVREFLGRRKLFIQESNSPTLQIIGDTFQVLDKAHKDSAKPLVAAASVLHAAAGKTVPQSDHASALEMVHQWLAAWSAQNMDAYAAFYASGFHSDGMNKTQWVSRKKKLSGRYSYINVTGKDFKIKKNKNGLAIRFFQTYESSGFSTTGIKQLTLVKKDGLWKISQENWKEK